MNVLFGLLAAGAIGCYLSIVIHSIALVAHRKPGISTTRLIFSGYLFWRFGSERGLI